MTDFELAATHTLTDDQVHHVLELIELAYQHDGVAPLNEAAMLVLTDPPDASTTVHVLALGPDGTPCGYLLADVSGDDAVHAECVVAPTARRRGVATAMLRAFLDGRPAESGGHVPPPLQVWAHGGLPGAAELAARLGFDAARTLLRLSLVLPEDGVPAPELPAGVTIRPFVPGQDDAAVLALNAEAFASHPEQGAMDRRDLRQRVESDWFDPAGFFLAERDGDLVGFHWTKVHAHEGAGEVYVLGVAPQAQGLGLGSVLTQVGLRHLAEQGLRTVMLYVEGDNAPALAVYRRQGFTEAARDVLYVHR
ncbi:MAG: mycothiol synthase [Nocardioidaceae bacterium]